MLMTVKTMITPTTIPTAVAVEHRGRKKGPVHPPGTLMTKTRELLNSGKYSIGDIYVATRIPWTWLEFFAKGKFKDPSVNRIQILYEFLSGHPLPL